jgi:hypothetical protein
MIIGAHSIIYSTKAGKDRAFLRDVIGLTHIDSGGGWLIFGLPPAEVAIHPANKNDVHEFYLLCDDIDALVCEMTERKVACAPIQRFSWGALTQITLPGGGKLGIYQPRHARPEPMKIAKPRRSAAERRGKNSTRRSGNTGPKTKAHRS